MRARLVVLTLVVAILTLGLVATGCSSDETTSSGEPGATTATFETVDVQTASGALSSNPDAQLLDVREPDEWAETGVGPEAVLIPLGDVEAQAPSELKADQPVYVICRTGNRSQTASEILVGLGFTQVYNVDGGITAWVDAGLPVEAYTP
jgi:rhodanese-related sulfurtransferase